MFRAEAQAVAGEIDDAIWYGPDDADWCMAIRSAGFDVVYLPDATVVHEYRRSTAARPVSHLAVRHLRAHVHFQRKWRRERRRLVAEGHAMDVEAGRAIPAAPARRLEGGAP